MINKKKQYIVVLLFCVCDKQIVMAGGCPTCECVRDVFLTRSEWGRSCQTSPLVG